MVMQKRVKKSTVTKVTRSQPGTMRSSKGYRLFRMDRMIEEGLITEETADKLEEMLTSDDNEIEELGVKLCQEYVRKEREVWDQQRNGTEESSRERRDDKRVL